MSFKDNKLFMEAIKKNDIFSIKSDLEGFIPEFKGNKILCDEVVDFAIKNSSFNWEKDDGISINTSNMSIKDRYNYEKGRLVQNFSQERYLRVLDLYNQYHNTDTSNRSELNNFEINLKKSKINKEGSSQKKKSFPSKSKITLSPLSIIVIVVIVLILLIVIF
ncbi:MAG: hypothetical protein ACRDDH_01700 [Cetobacterium sp.]|uniref:hypothetical protein n=1 Tax=Cetobacterium sp. TaxID=2071632 RepID=UPI003EE580B9